MSELISTPLILLIVTLFFVGVLIGWIISNHAELTAKRRLRIMISVVVTLGWLYATTASIFVTSYTVSPLVHALMGAIVGYFFTEDGVTFNVGGGE